MPRCAVSETSNNIDSYCLLRKRNDVKQLWLEKEDLNIFEVRPVKGASENVAPNIYYSLPVAKAQHLENVARNIYYSLPVAKAQHL